MSFTDRMLCVGHDWDHEADERQAEEAFDRAVAAVLESEAELLRGMTEQLLATGSVTISRPGGAVNACLRLPRWWQAGELRVWAEAPDGVCHAWSYTPLGRRRLECDHYQEEIRLRLATYLADLET